MLAVLLRVAYKTVLYNNNNDLLRRRELKRRNCMRNENPRNISFFGIHHPPSGETRRDSGEIVSASPIYLDRYNSRAETAEAGLNHKFLSSVPAAPGWARTPPKHGLLLTTAEVYSAVKLRLS